MRYLGVITEKREVNLLYAQRRGLAPRFQQLSGRAIMRLCQETAHVTRYAYTVSVYVSPPAKYFRSICCLRVHTVP